MITHIEHDSLLGDHSLPLFSSNTVLMVHLFRTQIDHLAKPLTRAIALHWSGYQKSYFHITLAVAFV